MTIYQARPFLGRRRRARGAYLVWYVGSVAIAFILGALTA